MMEHIVRSQKLRRATFRGRNGHREFLGMISRPQPECQADLFQIADATNSHRRAIRARRKYRQKEDYEQDRHQDNDQIKNREASAPTFGRNQFHQYQSRKTLKTALLGFALASMVPN